MYTYTHTTGVHSVWSGFSDYQHKHTHQMLCQQEAAVVLAGTHGMRRCKVYQHIAQHTVTDNTSCSTEDSSAPTVRTYVRTHTQLWAVMYVCRGNTQSTVNESWSKMLTHVHNTPDTFTCATYVHTHIRTYEGQSVPMCGVYTYWKSPPRRSMNGAALKNKTHTVTLPLSCSRSPTVSLPNFKER